MAHQSVYHLKFQSRCIASQVGETERNRFIVGTTSLREENEIHLIQYHEDTSDITCDRVYSHPNEIWSIAPCPHDASLFFTCYNTGTESKGGLWRMTRLDDRAGDGLVNLPLEEKATLDPKGDFLRCVLWNPAGKRDSVLSIDESRVRLWALEAGVKSMREINVASPTKNQKMWTGAWDPHHPEQLITACESSIKGWDTRALKQTSSIDQAHQLSVRDLDYNPNRPYVFVSGGDDNYIKFWDIRKTQAPLQSFPAHSHWVCQTKYNRFHDQFLISSSTDCMVNLWKEQSVSSVEGSTEEGATHSTKDGLVCKYEQHEESVYSVSWSASDAWSFASVSYDGRVAVSKVPESEKLHLLYS
mmetsp:Transcript_11473/g.19495  ORF Transcript_11473/g.19495 Transcript_11473/m.19495 type:complete len:358 (-) Transcript_11473:56-1129(-)|eukprot:CAMPEP_0184341636 /NCGR_PEP_ID=MMETSP1089-20130417/10243_1 /TAXON_ID=38269 ORGANISM="Gloeochaete wittrockiana, Strain SAG46.84" /NCGR_SAMPLE_ID=MMETSP1089 /ASSEMBLY_ACC=CAM_ASM_000445 /LENGTH=357 /DNA_ID=CAMNT_0026670047 /DNA_START=63 /DNA_END=1139 /DNA_ORIENTATION=-